MATSTHQSFTKKSSIDSYEKGRLFEEHIISLFNKRHFKVLEWNKAERDSELWTSGNLSDPDLKLMFSRSKNYQFAVECKWRKRFYGEKINWAKPHHIERYIEFARKKRIRVFIVIGIGGTPENPNELYVTPLDYIKYSTSVKRSDLPYNRKPTRRFFYNTVQLLLY